MKRGCKADADSGQMYFSYASPVVIPQGDGAYLVKPGRVTVRRDGDAVSPKEFARMQGCSRSSVYRFVNEGWISLAHVERRTPRRIRIRLEALGELRERIAGRA